MKGQSQGTSACTQENGQVSLQTWVQILERTFNGSDIELDISKWNTLVNHPSVCTDPGKLSNGFHKISNSRGNKGSEKLAQGHMISKCGSLKEKPNLTAGTEPFSFISSVSPFP